MPRKPSFPKEGLCRILEKNIDKILNENGKVIGPSQEIWTYLKTSHSLPLTEKALYTLALKEFGNNSKFDASFEREALISSSTESTLSSDEEQPIEPFSSILPWSSVVTINLSWNKWEVIRPMENTQSASFKSHRKYQSLKPGTWTDVFNQELWVKTRLPCTWIFKRARIYPNSESNYLRVSGKCKQCGSSLEGVCVEKPVPGTNVSILFKTTGDTSVAHSQDVKRPLRGFARATVCDELLKSKSSTALYRKNMARKHMELFDPEPPHMPSLQVLRKIKSEGKMKERLHRDPIQAIEMLKYCDPFRHALHEIGFDKFFVHFWTPDQLRVYNEYVKKHVYPKICIDATGGVVSKIRRPSENLSGHIFLYAGVVSIPGENEGQIPVLQMLSERHNANALTYWLNEWLRTGAGMPKEVVCDMSLALLNAASRAFAKLPDLQTYLEISFKILMNRENAFPLTCYIRIDVAHVIKLITKWKCLCGKRAKIREFFIRGIGQLILSRNLEDASNLLQALFVVALSETDGISESEKINTPCEDFKRWLKDRYATGEVQTLLVEHKVTAVLEEIDEDESSHLSTPQETEECVPINIAEWIDNIERRSKRLIGSDDGDHDNFHHLPLVVPKIKQLCNKLPLWSAIMVDYFKWAQITASSAAVESHFGDLKKRLMCPIPARADEFLQRHLQVIDGSMKLAAGRGYFHENPPQIDRTEFVQEAKMYTDKVAQTVNESANMCYADLNEDQLTPSVEISGNCVACKLTGPPSGAHKCVICGRGVHALPECSFPLGDEGYGQECICLICKQTSIPVQDESHEDQKEKIEKIFLVDTSIEENGLVESPTCNSATDSDSLKRAVVEISHDLNIPENYLQEMSLMENWRGKAIPPKKRSKYLTPNPEWKIMNMNSMTKSKVKIGLMKNGSNPNLKSITLGKKRISVNNTCAFDTLTQLLACCYSDSEEYRERVKDVTVGDRNILSLAYHIASKGIDRSVYRIRGEILLSLFEARRLPAGLLNIDCQITMTGIVERSLKNKASLYEMTECTSPFCSSPTEKKSFPLVRVNSDILCKGISNLQKAIEEGQCSENEITCYRRNARLPASSHLFGGKDTSSKSFCTGSRIRVVSPGAHLLVEVVSVEQSLPSQDFVYKGIGIETPFSCELRSIPLELTLYENKYQLRGCSGFIAPAAIGGLAHYVAYCRRIDGSWEIYDDLSEKVNDFSGNPKISTHVLVYSL